jgi:hypothetical protein
LAAALCKALKATKWDKLTVQQLPEAAAFVECLSRCLLSKLLEMDAVMTYLPTFANALNAGFKRLNKADAKIADAGVLQLWTFLSALFDEAGVAKPVLVLAMAPKLMASAFEVLDIHAGKVKLVREVCLLLINAMTAAKPWTLHLLESETVARVIRKSYMKQLNLPGQCNSESDLKCQKDGVELLVMLQKRLPNASLVQRLPQQLQNEWAALQVPKAFFEIRIWR